MAGLPAALERYLDRSLRSRGAVPPRVRIAQAGELWAKPGGRALRFVATQQLEVRRAAFAWRARFALGLRVVDAFAGGEGLLEVRVLGIPVQRQRGPEIAAGEALRYLAELPWVPYAMAHNAELGWRELGKRTFEVATDVRGERLAVELELDAAGDIVRASSRQRRRRVGKRWVPTPWVGEFGAYSVLGGLRVPTRGEVRWEGPEGSFTYWRGTITALELDS